MLGCSPLPAFLRIGGTAPQDDRETTGSECEVANHVAALEMDGGCERPVGWGLGMEGASAEPPDPV